MTIDKDTVLTGDAEARNKARKASMVILMADDDDDDFLLAQKALKQSKLLNTLHRVKDGEELLEYLRGKDRRPGVVLLDLNMPRKDGREALKEIKSDPALCDIPVIVFTTSKAEEDIFKSYQLGVNSFITKPVTFESLIQVMQALGKYWFEIVELPVKPETSNSATDSKAYK
jgi:CheY-like chemotaxis protein